MEEMNIQLKSIWGKWWEPIRKWFYPLWLAYETSFRFYQYALSVQTYYKEQHGDMARYLGEFGSQFLGVFCAVGTFAICTAFLTVPACFVLYRFFKSANLTSTPLEAKLKPYL